MFSYHSFMLLILISNNFCSENHTTTWKWFGDCKFMSKIKNQKTCLRGIEIKKLIDDAETVSFDIFDTLLLRPYDP